MVVEEIYLFILEEGEKYDRLQITINLIFFCPAWQPTVFCFLLCGGVK